MNALNELYAELEQVERMTAAEVMQAYNADSKEEIIELIHEDIQSLTRNTHDDYSEEDLEQDRTNLCLSQGLSRYC